MDENGVDKQPYVTLKVDQEETTDSIILSNNDRSSLRNSSSDTTKQHLLNGDNDDVDSDDDDNINHRKSILVNATIDSPTLLSTVSPTILHQQQQLNDDNDDQELDENDFVTSDQHKVTASNDHKPNIYERVLTVSNRLLLDADMYRHELMHTVIYLACFISLGISVGSLGPTLLSLAKNTNSSIDQVGYFFTARGLGYFLGSFAGRVYDRIGNANLLVSGATVLMAASLFCIPLVHNLYITGIFFFFDGVGGGLIDAGLNVLIVWIWKKKVNPFMQLLHFAFGLGALLAPFLISMMIESTLFKQYLVLSIIMVASAIPVFFIKSVEPYHSDENVSEPISKAEKRLRIEVIIAVALFLFTYIGAEAGFGGWIYTYAKVYMNMNDKPAALLNSLFWTTFTISRFAGVFVSMVLTPNQMVILDMIGCFIFTFLLVFFKHSMVVLWIATAGIGISLASIFPTCFSLPQNLNMPVTGEGSSYLVLGATFGEITIPWLMGVVQHRIGMHVLPYCISICLFVSLFIYVAIIIRAKIVRAREKGNTIELKSFLNVNNINGLLKAEE